VGFTECAVAIGELACLAEDLPQGYSAEQDDEVRLDQLDLIVESAVLHG
jgi:hypothetical protein